MRHAGQRASYTCKHWIMLLYILLLSLLWIPFIIILSSCSHFISNLIALSAAHMVTMIMSRHEEQEISRPGPAQNLRFVVANDPDQFRDRSTMRSNRSHVMHNHLSEKRASTGSAPKVTAESSGGVRKRTRSSTPSRSHSRSYSKERPSLERSVTEQVMSSEDAIAIYRRTMDPKLRSRRRGTTSSEAGSARSSPKIGSPSCHLETPPTMAMANPFDSFASLGTSGDLLVPQDMRCLAFVQGITGELPFEYSLNSPRIFLEAFRDHSGYTMLALVLKLTSLSYDHHAEHRRCISNHRALTRRPVDLYRNTVIDFYRYNVQFERLTDRRSFRDRKLRGHADSPAQLQRSSVQSQ